MFFKVPGDIDIRVYPDQETLEELIAEAIEDGATSIEVYVTIVRKETLN